MDVTLIRPYEPPGCEDGGRSGYATLRVDGQTYELDYSTHSGLSVLRAGDFPSPHRDGWCGVNYDDDDRIRPGYYDSKKRWVDVEPIATDRRVREWAEAHYRELFGLACAPRPDRTPYHKPDHA
jgi:hypothetical protein